MDRESDCRLSCVSDHLGTQSFTDFSWKWFQSLPVESQRVCVFQFSALTVNKKYYCSHRTWNNSLHSRAGIATWICPWIFLLLPFTLLYHSIYIFLGLCEYKMMQVFETNLNVSGGRCTSSFLALISCFLVPIWKPWALWQPASFGRWQPQRMNMANACCPWRQWLLSLYCDCIPIRAMHRVCCTLHTDLWPAGLAGDTSRDNGTILLLEL